jgi:Rps23 Pro-64 3,4-dihydroxylase Tpa1-like proline 4-hydroxylase
MTSKQLIDAFSEGLMRDERILTSRERELLLNLLRNAREASGSPETQSAVNKVIARSVGETVAQRAFALLGSSIVEQIIGHGSPSTSTEENHRARFMRVGTPTPPQPPSPAPAEKPPQPPNDEEPTESASVRVEASWPTTAQSMHVFSGSRVGVMEAPAIVEAQSVVLDEFLAPQEMEELISFTQRHEMKFKNSAVISPSGETGRSDYTHRRSRVLMDLGPHEDVILNRIRGVLPRVLEELGIEAFPIRRTETQITASNDGDFFHAHRDDSQQRVATRRITFVYFFHREPNPFEGGELLLHDSRFDGDQPAAGSYQTIQPRQNQIVFFPCSTLHEITAVRCRSRAFADSRFTVNGWLHQ